MTTKVCTTCRVAKPLDDFYREGAGPGRAPRRKSSCKTCHSARNAAAQATPAGKALRKKRRPAEYQRAKARTDIFRERRFFCWRARLWRRRYKVPMTGPMLARLWLDQKGRCALSGRKLTRAAHLDHIVAVANGGPHDITNLRWLDPDVNVALGKMTDAEFITLCQDVLAQRPEGP